jgi:3-deoxy-D-manno-octulosonic-acid transferase
VRFIYSLAFYLLLPLILFYFLWRSRKEPGYRRRWVERFGAAPVGRPGGIWLHAASVGEVQAARPLVESLLAAHPKRPLVVTCITPTGSQRILELWGDRVQHAYLPFDVPGSVERFLDRVQPALGIVLETEIWPNLYLALARRGTPLLMVSARLSEGSLQRLQRFPGSRLLRDCLAHVAAILAQTPDDAERYRSAGVDDARISVAGNLKFDYRVDPAAVSRAQVLREGWGATRPVWIAASTHAGEEDIMLEAHARLRERMPDLLLVLVPRHPQRFEAVADLCTRAGMSSARRSRGETGTPEHAVVLVDTMGELNLFYAASDLAFVGGSLVPVGGHNLLEPAALGLPILTGPHMHSQQDITQRLLAAGGARQVSDLYELIEAVEACLASPALHHQSGIAARHVIEQNRGALARVMAQVALHLPASGAAPA